MPPSNRGTTQNSESQRRGAGASTGRTQGKTVPVSSSRSTGRSNTTSNAQRQSATTRDRASSSAAQSNQAQTRPGQVNQASVRPAQSGQGTAQSRSTRATGQTQSTQTTGQTRPTQGIGQTQAAQSIAQTQSTQGTTQTQSPAPTQAQTSTPQADRELPVQSSRETSQPNAGQSIGRTAGQNAPVYGGYGNYGGAIANPFVAIRRMMEDMDRFVSNFGLGANIFPPSLFSQDPFGTTRGSPQSAGGIQKLWNPEVEVFQRGDRVVVRADLPGLKKEDVSVEIDRNALTIRGERRHEFENESEGIYRSERSYGTFQRSIPLPEGITADDAQASFNDGVLEVTLPAPRNQASARKVQIR